MSENHPLKQESRARKSLGAARIANPPRRKRRLLDSQRRLNIEERVSIKSHHYLV